MRAFFLIIILCFLCFHIQGQSTDDRAWITMQVNGEFSEKYYFTFRPIVRLDENLSSYRNTSIDLAVRRKLHNYWSVQLLSRTFFIPDKDIIQFGWLDFHFRKTWSKIKLLSILRFHLALDLFNKNNPDYIRSRSIATWMTGKKWKPLIAFEPWFRLNGISEFQRIRYEVGMAYDIDTSLQLILAYRREDTIGVDPSLKLNEILITARYSLRRNRKAKN